MTSIRVKKEICDPYPTFGRAYWRQNANEIGYSFTTLHNQRGEVRRGEAKMSRLSYERWQRRQRQRQRQRRSCRHQLCHALFALNCSHCTNHTNAFNYMAQAPAGTTTTTTTAAWTNTEPTHRESQVRLTASQSVSQLFVLLLVFFSLICWHMY